MPLTENASWVDDFVSSYDKAIHDMDWDTLRPFSFLQFHPLYASQWRSKIISLLDACKNQGISDADLAKLGWDAGIWRDQLFFLSLDMKSARVPVEKRLAVFEFFNRGILASVFRDHYGKNSNIGHKQSEVSAMLREYPWHHGNPEHARQLGKLYSAAIHLVHALYGDIYTGYSADNFGPYDVSRKYGKGHILVIRKFRDLKPLDVWPRVDSFPCKSLWIYTVYSGVSYSCDAISCHSIFKGNVLEGLVDWSVRADGDFVVSPAAISALTDDLMPLAVGQWQRLTSLPFEEAKQKWLELRCFIFKALFERAGLDWRPSDEMRDAVRGKKLAPPSYWNAPATNARAFWRKMLDPRLDFYPQGQG